MIRWPGHPTFAKLSRYADGELTGEARDHMAAHLAACERCRDTIRFIRELGDVARRLPEPEPPADALPRFLARRAAGERVILPTADPVPLEVERKRALPAIAAMLTLAVVGTLLVSVPRLSADRSRLEFEPARPRAGETIRVRYESGTLLRSEATLVLRGRLHYENGEAEILEVSRLTRGSDGAFHGSVSLPDSAVYGAFAVEDTAATRVDSNTRRLWELVVHGRDGRPRFEALRERIDDLVYRHWELAYQTARTLTRLYPDRAWGWQTLFSFERALVRGADRDSLTRDYRERLHRLDRLSRRAEPDADDAASLAFFAMLLEEEEIHRYWRERIRLSAPQHPTSVQFTIFDLNRDAGVDGRLTAFERLWNDAGRGHQGVAFAALSEALRRGDPAATFVWADRYVRLAPDDAGPVAESLVESVPVDEPLFDWLERSLRAVQTGALEPRDLHETEARYRRKLTESASTIHGVIARANLAVNRVDRALEHLTAAADARWDPDVFDSLARTLAAHGHTTTAAEYLARVAIDPLVDSTRVARTVDIGRAWLGGPGWDRAVDRARDALAMYMDRDAAYRRIPPEITVLTPGGAPATTGAALTGHVTLVVFWSPLSAPAIAALPEIERVARLLRRQGVSTIAIYLGDVSDRAARTWKDAAPSVSLYFDPELKAATAFGQWGAPEYFVVDHRGIVRFHHSALPTAVRQATRLVPGPDRLRLVAP